MDSEIKKLQKILLESPDINALNIVFDKESREYSGCDFTFNNVRYVFRKAKVTPKKIGLFVTFWKRNMKNITEPFHENDDFQYYIIVVEEQNNFGYFVFPRDVLVSEQYLKTDLKDGKRGFRVYPKWSETINKQAKKTQMWQLLYFNECSEQTFVNMFGLFLIHYK